MNDLGRTIAKLRERAGLSQKDLATKMCLHGAQITNQAVSKWENGTTQPSASQFLICPLYSLTVIIFVSLCHTLVKFVFESTSQKL